MKLLKYLAIAIGLIFLLSILFKMFQKSVKTSIFFDGIDRVKDTATLTIMANGQLVTVYDIPLSVASSQVYAANDYRVDVSQLGNLIVFKVLDEQNNVLATKPVDKTKPVVFPIYSE